MCCGWFSGGLTLPTPTKTPTRFSDGHQRRVLVVWPHGRYAVVVKPDLLDNRLHESLAVLVRGGGV